MCKPTFRFNRLADALALHRRSARLALVGLRGAGKSTLGAMLAKEFEKLRREMAGRLMPDAIEARR